MGQIQSYYRILGLEADASTEEIREAIANMRDLDTEGNYTAILNKIEKTLLPLSNRPKDTPAAAPAPAAKPASGRRVSRDRGLAADDEWDDGSAAPAEEPPKFLDIDDGGHDTSWNIDRTPVKDHRSFITEEEIRAYNKPPSLFSKIFNFRNIVLLLLAAGVGVAGFIFGMPLYQQYMANTQSNDALATLIRARDEADNYLRKNHYFPDALVGAYDSPLYSVRANSGDETILLTFNQEAAEPLRGHALIMRTELVANIGLQWRCDISGGFPPTHKPAQCY